MADQRPCSCDGSNENCARCFGRGFIEASPAGLAGKSKSSTGTRYYRGRAKGRTFSLPSHLGSATYRASSASSRPTAECQYCKAQVRVDRLSKHLELRCPLRPNKPSRPRPQEVTIGAPFGVRAVAAKVSATKGRTQVNPLGRPGTMQAKNVDKNETDCPFGKGAFQKSLRDKGESDIERPSWWDNLDATKNRGYPAREDGRYGSYPSHDGFDDESKP
jgi:hypothetical protein